MSLLRPFITWQESFRLLDINTHLNTFITCLFIYCKYPSEKSLSRWTPSIAGIVTHSPHDILPRELPGSPTCKNKVGQVGGGVYEGVSYFNLASSNLRMPLDVLIVCNALKWNCISDLLPLIANDHKIRTGNGILNSLQIAEQRQSDELCGEFCSKTRRLKRDKTAGVSCEFW